VNVDNDAMINRLITRSLGEMLKRAREEAGLSQTDLAALLPSKPHAKTLAAYEQGARQCTVVRLCEIAGAVGVSPMDLLARALLHAEIELQTARVHVDLAILADESGPELRHLRKWARTRLAAYPERTIVELDGNALQEMAVIYNTTLTGLVNQLALYAPDPDASRSVAEEDRI
jgi:transcriptional regulator with XRE-family HTH domain